MTTVAEVVDAVIGVDTHRDTHTLELTSPLGVALARLKISNCTVGFSRALDWARQNAPGPNLMAGVEGTRSYGIALTRAFQTAGLPTFEVEQPSNKQRRGKGKSDPIDAHHAARTLLATDLTRLAEPRMDGTREALRILLISREEQVLTHTRQANQLHALLLAGDDTDRELNRGALTQKRLKTILARPLPDNPTLEQTVRHHEIERLATALISADTAIRNNTGELQRIVSTIAAGLLEQTGIGPISAAQALVTFSHPGRCRNEAAFAMLAGSAPLPASSGLTSRHRLNYGGDRAMNRALHTIAMSRWRTDPETQAYIERRRQEGKTDKEIRRCLKRYISRQIYRQLNSTLDKP